MLESLKQAVHNANLELTERRVVIYTWGNASGIDRESGCVVIKPSGLDPRALKADDMVVVSLADGQVIEGKYRPSTDTATHLELYRAWAGIGGIVHTHSTYATAWAQARREIPPLGTTQADFALGSIPCTRLLTTAETLQEYEANVGRLILERFAGLDPMRIPAVLVADHGPFVWGSTPQEAVYNAVVLEEIACVGVATLTLDPGAEPISKVLLNRHFYRKHGPKATYGQDTNPT